jgi:crotonobetaine/carnitine-CoA ligase
MTATIGRIPRTWLSDADAVYSCWPMFHVTGRSPLCTMADVGGRVVLRERFSLADFWPDVRAHGCTSTTIGAVTPLLLGVPSRDDDRDHPLRHVLFGNVGASGLAVLDRFGLHGLAFYGSTEAGFPILNRAITAENAAVLGQLRPGYRARVVDPGGNDVASGDIGELWIRPPDRRLILREYLDDPARTASAVVDGWYRTGDAVRRLDDGCFVFVDRLRDTIRRFGENISSSAVEAAVADDADVLECAVFGVPSAVTGQEVALLVVPAPGVAGDPAGLAARLRELLPRHLCPAYVAFVDELPRTPTGKVRKAELAERFATDAAWPADTWRGTR